MTMAHGVENRVPFLDRRVVDFARTLPAEHLVGDVDDAARQRSSSRNWRGGRLTTRSSIARKALSTCRSRSISGARRFTELMEDRLLPGMRRRGLVSEPAVRELWRRSLSAPALTELFWIPVALELWAQQFVDGRRLETRLYVSA